MVSVVRDATLGQVGRLVSRGKFLRYPDELPDFELPYNLVEKDKQSDNPDGESSGVSSTPTSQNEGEREQRPHLVSSAHPMGLNSTLFDGIRDLEASECSPGNGAEASQKQDQGTTLVSWYSNGLLLTQVRANLN